HTRLVSDWSSDVCSSDLLATPNDKMWEPSHGELRAAKIITGVANSRQFATSGSFAKLVSSDQFEEELLTNIPIYATLKRVEPQRSEEHTSELQSLTNLVC